MTLQKFYAGNRFGLLIDLRSMADQTMHGSCARLVNTTDGVQLEIEQRTKGSGTVNCHVFVISDSQLNIMGRQLESVQNSIWTPATFPSTRSSWALPNQGKCSYS